MVFADTIEARFAFSGKAVRVNKRAGDRVKKGEILASLDRTLLQKELDRQLADYEKTRAGFEIFAKKNPNPGDDLTIYAKKIEQAQLDVSVKEVEIAKLHLDQADLVCQVNGIIVDDGGNRGGLFVTPASNAFRITDMDSLRFRIEIESGDLAEFAKETEVKVKIGETDFAGKTRLPYFDGKKFVVDVILPAGSDLMPGLAGEVIL